MKSLLRHSFLILLLALGSPLQSAPSKPNVIYILEDDLGYGDLSCYGQTKLSTPNMDRLASEGIKFTDHYSGNTVCSPSRAALMTGQHSGVCYLRGNVTGEPPLDHGMTVLPEVFKAAGYATGAFGKWGLGLTVGEGANNPLSHGFDEFYGWNSQGIAHTYFPSSVIHNGREIPLPEGTYVHTLIMDQARDFIRRHAKAGTPFVNGKPSSPAAVPWRFTTSAKTPSRPKIWRLNARTWCGPCRPTFKRPASLCPSKVTSPSKPRRPRTAGKSSPRRSDA